MRRLSWKWPLVVCLIVTTSACTSGAGEPATTDTANQTSLSPNATAEPVGPVVQVSVGTCGQGWTDPRAGLIRFTLSNVDTRAAEVFLVVAGTGAVVGTVDPLGPGTRAALAVQLPVGSYAFKCAMEDADVVTGPTVTVLPATGDDESAVDQAAPVLPVSQSDMITPTRRYEQYVTGQLPALVRSTSGLLDDVKTGHLDSARTLWLTSHLQYERLGAAYGAVGDADGEINGLPNGLPQGVNDRGFTGFHRLEYGLWHGQSAAELTPVASALAAAVKNLRGTFESAQIDPLEVAIRAHEITENTLQFELTGQTDFGSGSNLATADANLAGTRTVLDLLRPLLKPRYPALQQLDALLDRATSDVEAFGPQGKWKPLTALTTAQRERLDADFGELTELLAPVATICEPRRTS